MIIRKFYIFIFFYSLVISAQESVKSSKLIEQLSYSITDSARISVNYKLGEYYLNSKTDSSYFYYLRALQLAEKIKDTISKGYILHDLGYKYDIDSNHKIALETYFKAKDRYILNKDSLGIAQIENNIGYCYMHLFDEDKAIGHYLESIALYRKFEDEEGIALNLTDIASLYYDFENYDFAIKKYKEALEIYKKLNDLEGISGTYTNIGGAVSDKGNCDDGLAYFIQSIEIQEKIGDTLGLAINYNNIGDCYIQMKEYKKALEYFKKATEFNTIANSRDLESIIHLNKAQAELDLKQYKKAIETSKKSLEISKKIGNTNYLIDNYKSLATSYEMIGNKKLSLEYLKKYRKLQDSLIKKDNKKKIKLFNALNNLEKSDSKLKELQSKKEIADLKYKNERKLIYFLIAASTIFCILLIILINQQAEKKKAYNLLAFKNHQIRKMNQEIEIQRDDLKSLNVTKDKFFSIIAHDLKNPFNSINGFSELMIENIGMYPEDKQLNFLKIIKKSAGQASELLDNLLIWASSQSGSLKFSPSTINLYDIVESEISLLHVQAEKKEILVKNSIDGNVKVFADENMIKTIIRNLLSNAIKFTKLEGLIEINAKYTNSHIEIIIKDNGLGMSEETISTLFSLENKLVKKGTANEHGTGLGLILCKEFVEKHNGEIWVNSKLNKGTEFVFTLPSIKS
ncbi:tetratricopeptide repeat-containing sensor histidine kinase [Lutibacter sp. TH_r2]|uniref:tetratricopeptide repeat-containing sensor histidine kinase n=1 Tax=Lutibacter sp. TH_r2 TaxID=3082083 RepID=UPI0029549E07|nr:tetratricopeptide repeat-containing sensor histidine kinase [Lutibacter sp. TH_r2]MDV7188013.1 tetratricopeptide repeat-containing sensor histidine kinase [Lutibacter sp. TH_r2]